MVETKLERYAYRIRLGNLRQWNQHRKQQPLINDQRPSMIPFSISSKPKWNIYFKIEILLIRSAYIFGILLFYLQLQEATIGYEVFTDSNKVLLWKNVFINKNYQLAIWQQELSTSHFLALLLLSFKTTVIIS